MLLSDFHVHTTWSDGRLPMPQVVDLFGRAGHDVIAITDHVVSFDVVLGKVARSFGLSITRENFDQYFDEFRREADRAWDEYEMLMIPGFELTHNRITRKESAHALVLGIDHFISADGSVLDMLARAESEAPVTVACHPHEQSDWFANTFLLWNRREEVARYIDRWEVATRWDLFPPVSRARYPYLGNSDFHQPAHLYAWKTLLPCEKNVDAVLELLGSEQELAVTRLAAPSELAAPESSRVPTFEPAALAQGAF